MTSAPSPQPPPNGVQTGYIDLHCHCVPGVDDGVRTHEEASELLLGLASLGFGQVVATPHMRPGLFDNTRVQLEAAFSELHPSARWPALTLACEHYFDGVVFERLLQGNGLPYPGARAVLLEFYDCTFETTVQHRLAQLNRRRMRPVIAHPERYPKLAASPQHVERLLDVGAVLLLDIASLVGHYGRAPRRAAERLLDAGFYAAACSDAHRPRDLPVIAQALDLLAARYGAEEQQRLLCDGPRAILDGNDKALM